MSELPVREEERAAGYTYDVVQTFNGPVIFNGPVTFTTPLPPPVIGIDGEIIFNEGGTLTGDFTEFRFFRNQQFFAHLEVAGLPTTNSQVNVVPTEANLFSAMVIGGFNQTSKVEVVPDHISLQTINGGVAPPAQIKQEFDGTNYLININAESTNIFSRDTTDPTSSAHVIAAAVGGPPFASMGADVGANGSHITTEAEVITAQATSTVTGGTVNLRGKHINLGFTVTYANNAAAIAGGLAAGDMYAVTGTDPRQLAIVF